MPNSNLGTFETLYIRNILSLFQPVKINSIEFYKRTLFLYNSGTQAQHNLTHNMGTAAIVAKIAVIIGTAVLLALGAVATVVAVINPVNPSKPGINCWTSSSPVRSMTGVTGRKATSVPAGAGLSASAWSMGDH